MLSKINKHFFPDIEDVDQNFIYLSGEITIESCAATVESILAMNMPRQTVMEDGLVAEVELPDVINLFVTSVGGDMTAAFGLIAVMRGSDIPIRTIALGEASSAGLAILMAGHQRVVTPYTSLMSHTFSSGTEGTYDDLETSMKAFRAYKAKMVQFYKEFTGLDEKFINKTLLSHNDHHFDGEAAPKYNIVDLISDLS